MVQFLPDAADGPDDVGLMAAQPPQIHAIPLVVGHSVDINIHFRRGFRIPFCPEPAGLDDFGGFPGQEELGHRVLPVRSRYLQGTEPQGQGARPCIHPCRDAPYLDRLALGTSL